MVDLTKGPEPDGTGKPVAAPEPGTTVTEPAPDDGQAGSAADGAAGTIPMDPTAPAPEDTFFDASNVPEELKIPYKQMQGAFSKKMKGLSTEKEKVDAYNLFMSDPVGQLKALAAQHGMTINQAGVVAPDNGTAGSAGFEPKSWDEVLEHFESKIMSKFQGHMKPVFDNVQKLTTTNIESQLTELDPQWRMHEDTMMQNLKAHPTLVNNISMLYKMSVPESVLNSKATQLALKSMDKKATAAKMQGSRGVHKSTPVTQKISSFNDAVNAAKEEGKKDGWYKG